MSIVVNGHCWFATLRELYLDMVVSFSIASKQKFFECWQFIQLSPHATFNDSGNKDWCWLNEMDGIAVVDGQAGFLLVLSMSHFHDKEHLGYHNGHDSDPPSP
jgi:hypothetical protein